MSFVFSGAISPTATGEIEEIRWVSLNAHGEELRLAPLLVEHVIPALKSTSG